MLPRFVSSDFAKVGAGPGKLCIPSKNAVCKATGGRSRETGRLSGRKAGAIDNARTHRRIFMGPTMRWLSLVGGILIFILGVNELFQGKWVLTAIGVLIIAFSIVNIQKHRNKGEGSQ